MRGNSQMINLKEQVCLSPWDGVWRAVLADIQTHVINEVRWYVSVPVFEQQNTIVETTHAGIKAGVYPH